MKSFSRIIAFGISAGLLTAALTGVAQAKTPAASGASATAAKPMDTKASKATTSKSSKSATRVAKGAKKGAAHKKMTTHPAASKGAAGKHG